MIGIFFWFYSNILYAANYLTIRHSAVAGDSLKAITLSFLKDNVKPPEANRSLVLTMKNNPKIKNWNPFIKNETFKLYLDPSIVDLKKYNAAYQALKQKDLHHLSIFSMPSIGYFTQSNNTGFTVKYNQISMFSIGMAYLYTPYKGPVNVSASFYYSSISSTTNQLGTAATSTSVNIPNEYGFNIYANLSNKDALSFYAGVDYESFSSFNLETILNTGSVIIDTNNVLYATAGVNYRPGFMEKLLLRFSLSKSIFTTYSSEVDVTNKVTISGLKMLFYVNYKINDKWSVAAMFKNHDFSGENDLSINRIGLGLNYSFF